MRRSNVTLGIACLLALVVSISSAQDVVYRKVTSEKLEGLFKELNIETKKTSGKKEGVFFYDYERNGFKIRFHNYEGNDIWVDAIFTDKTTLEQINRWNIRAKFSRAVLIKDQNKESISLESQFDCGGGVTDNIIKQFINRFDGELTSFRKFLSD